MKGTTTANQAREVALQDACRDVCMYCAGHCPQWDATAHGPNEAGNHYHWRKDGQSSAMCAASAIWCRISYEKRSGPIYAD